MQLYRELLRITEEIEHSLKNNAFESLTSLQKERQMIFDQLQNRSTLPGPPDEIAALLKMIRSTEDKCTKLAKVRKNLLAKELKSTGRAKKLHSAYGRQAQAY